MGPRTPWRAPNSEKKVAWGVFRPSPITDANFTQIRYPQRNMHGSFSGATSLKSFLVNRFSAEYFANYMFVPGVTSSTRTAIARSATAAHCKAPRGRPSAAATVRLAAKALPAP